MADTAESDNRKRNEKLIEQSELSSSTPIPTIPFGEGESTKKPPKKTNDANTDCPKTLRRNTEESCMNN